MRMGFTTDTYQSLTDAFKSNVEANVESNVDRLFPQGERGVKSYEEHLPLFLLYLVMMQ